MSVFFIKNVTVPSNSDCLTIFYTLHGLGIFTSGIQMKTVEPKVNLRCQDLDIEVKIGPFVLK